MVHCNIKIKWVVKIVQILGYKQLYIYQLRNYQQKYSLQMSIKLYFQAGGLDRAKSSLPKIKDEERESMFGNVFAVSGPGNLFYLPCVNFSYMYMMYNSEKPKCIN